MKILMTLPYPSVQSPLNDHLPLLIAELDMHKIQVVSFCYGRTQQKTSIIRSIFCSFVNLFRFMRIAKKERPDVVQINSSFNFCALIRDIVFISFVRKEGRKIFLKFHGSLDSLLYSDSFILRGLSHLLMTLVDKIGLLTFVEMEIFRKRYQKHHAKFIVVKNPIDIEAVHRCSVNPCAKRKPLNILYASRMIKKKGIYDVINAIPHVLEEIDARFILAGDGTDLEKIISLIDHKNIQEKTTCMGHVPFESIKHLYSIADVFLFPSYFPEGMPMAIVYALASGVPIVTTRVRFVDENLVDGRHCLTFPVGSSKQLASQVIRLANNPSLREKMSCENKILAKRFSLATVGKEYIQLYERLTVGTKW